MKYTFKAGAEEWLKFREKRITGTELGSLFDVNPYKKIDKLVHEKLTGEVKFRPNVFALIGRIFEPSLVQYVKEVHGLKASLEGGSEEVVVYALEDCPVSVTLDGTLDIEGIKYPLECKTMLLKSFIEKNKSTIPDYYILQLAAQCMALNTDTGYFILGLHEPASYDMTNFLPLQFHKFFFIKMVFPKGLFDLIRSESRKFGIKCLTNGELSYILDNKIKTKMQFFLNTIEKTEIIKS